MESDIKLKNQIILHGFLGFENGELVLERTDNGKTVNLNQVLVDLDGKECEIILTYMEDL